MVKILKTVTLFDWEGNGIEFQAGDIFENISWDGESRMFEKNNRWYIDFTDTLMAKDITRPLIVW